VRGEIMGSHKCRSVGKSQSVLIMIDPIISPRTRVSPGESQGGARARGREGRGGGVAAAAAHSAKGSSSSSSSSESTTAVEKPAKAWTLPPASHARSRR
jgi:hypothetical protein